MRVTIVGPGKMGRGLSTRLLTGGHAVTLVGRDPAAAERLAAELLDGPAADGADVTAAPSCEAGLAYAEVVILAMPYAANLAAARDHGGPLAGRVIIDISNPIKDTYDGLVTECGPSAAESIAAELPPGSRLVKAFNTTFAGTLVSGSVAGEPLDVYIAGDDHGANRVVAELVRTSGMHPVVVGCLARSRQLEALGFLGIAVQKPLGYGFMSGWKLVAPREGAN